MSLHIKLNLIGVLCPLCIDSRVFADFLCSKVKFVRAFFFLVPAAECIAFGCKFSWIARVLIVFDYLFCRSCSMSLNIKLNFVLVYRPLRINSCIFADFLCSKIKLACAFFILIPTVECIALSCKLARILCVRTRYYILFLRCSSITVSIKCYATYKYFVRFSWTCLNIILSLYTEFIYSSIHILKIFCNIIFLFVYTFFKNCNLWIRHTSLKSYFIFICTRYFIPVHCSTR